MASSTSSSRVRFRTVMCIPAADAPSWSSCVADERTAKLVAPSLRIARSASCTARTTSPGSVASHTRAAHCVEPFVRHVRGPKQSARSIRDLEDTRIERIADPARHRVRGRNRKARTGQSRQAPGFAPVAGGSPRNDRFDSLQYPRHLDLVVLAQPSGGSTRGDGRQRSPALWRDPWR